MPKRARAVTLTGADAAALIAFRPDLSALARDLAAPHAWFARDGVDAAVGSLAATGLWLAALWLAAGLVAAAATWLPGRSGRGFATVARVLLPTVVRRVLAGSAGLGVLLAPAVAASAHAPGDGAALARGGVTHSAPVIAETASPTTIPSPLPAPGWPTTPPPHMHATPSATPTPAATPAPIALPAPAWPQAPQASTRAHGSMQPAAAAHTSQRVRVQSGDSLWLLAARRLGPHATDHQIAHAWPRWYAANRATIGPDPDRLVPGTVLHAPAANPEEAP